MKRILTIAALMIAASPLAFGQTTTQSKPSQATAGQKGGSAEQEVLKANKEYGEAFVRGDAAAYDRFLADDYIYTNPTGGVADKARMMKEIKSGDMKLESGQDDDVRVRVYGDTAVVTGLWTAKGQHKGNAFNNKERYTAVYVKRGGRWQVVAEQLTNVGAQPQGQQQQPNQQPTEKKP